MVISSVSRFFAVFNPFNSSQVMLACGRNSNALELYMVQEGVTPCSKRLAKRSPGCEGSWQCRLDSSWYRLLASRLLVVMLSRSQGKGVPVPETRPVSGGIILSWFFSALSFALKILQNGTERLLFTRAGRLLKSIVCAWPV